MSIPGAALGGFGQDDFGEEVFTSFEGKTGFVTNALMIMARRPELLRARHLLSEARTEEATLREGQLCRREGITINTFLLQSWWQSSEDVQFARKLSESTTGRVFFTAGKDLDRYVVWDYVQRRREIIS